MMPHTPSLVSTFGKKKEINRRQSIRYSMSTPMQYRVIENGKTILSDRGQILDMSAGGLRISVGRTLQPGAVVEMAMDWPGLYHGKQKMRLLLAAEVLRSDELSAGLRILRHEFRNAPVRMRAASRPERRAVA